jgi:hypothetical protein
MAQNADLPIEDRPERRILTIEDLIASVRLVVNYNWSDERHDYAVAEAEGNSREGHVFEHLYALNTWLADHA